MAKKTQEPGGEKTRKPKAESLYVLVKVEAIINTGTSDEALVDHVANLAPGTYAVALARRVITAEPATGVVLKPANVFESTPQKAE
jgi:hypothetical protein